MTHFTLVRSLIPGGMLSLMALAAWAQPNDHRITPNFKDTDIRQVAEAVSAATGKNFIIDPRARAQVNMFSATPLSPEAFYEAFLSILQVHGFIAVPAGDIIKIVPENNARQMPSIDLPDRVNSRSDEIVTQVIDVKNVSAAQLVPILRPLIPQYGQLAAHPASNVLIVSDRANNVSRIINIIHRIDQVGDRDVEMTPLQNASANEVVRVINALYQQQAAGNAEGGATTKIVADERSNSVLIGGDPAQRLRIRALVALLDTPLDTGGESQVRYLQFADAEKLVPLLKEQITGLVQATAGSGASAQPAPQAAAEKNTMVWADPETNALVITAPPKLMRALMSIIDKLDIRRSQVLVEAVIVEVNTDKTSDLGVNWAAWSNSEDTVVPLGGFISSVGGSSALDIYSAITGISSGTTTSSSALTGTTLAAGKISANGINYGAMVRAVRGDASTNVIATPSAVTMDNQEAELKVAQDVPFVTGSYTTTSGSSSNPFTTVSRQEVGTILKVTPQIAAEGNSVMLKISIESSSVAATSVSDVDITTNKRTVSTAVLIDDGGIVVLGGLISDGATKSEQRVPFLSRIPILGLAFKTRDQKATKNNLMIFIRPKIMRDAAQAAYITGSKYNYMLGEQRKADVRELLPLLPGVKPPQLPPLPPEPEKK
jgi:general secretion pathway protein D